jgi:hypothetical protein
MANGGKQQSLGCFRGICPFHHLAKTKGFDESLLLFATAPEKGDCFTHMPCLGHVPKISGLCLEAVVGLANIMKGGEYTEPSHLPLGQIIKTAKSRKPFAQKAFPEQCLAARRHIGAVVKQRVPF